MHAVISLADLGSLGGAQLASAVAGSDHRAPAEVPMAAPAAALAQVLTANAAAVPGKAGAPLGRGAACGSHLRLKAPAGPGCQTG